MLMPAVDDTNDNTFAFAGAVVACATAIPDSICTNQSGPASVRRSCCCSRYTAVTLGKPANFVSFAAGELQSDAIVSNGVAKRGVSGRSTVRLICCRAVCCWVCSMVCRKWPPPTQNQASHLFVLTIGRPAVDPSSWMM